MRIWIDLIDYRSPPIIRESLHDKGKKTFRIFYSNISHSPIRVNVNNRRGALQKSQQIQIPIYDFSVVSLLPVYLLVTLTLK